VASRADFIDREESADALANCVRIGAFKTQLVLQESLNALVHWSASLAAMRPWPMLFRTGSEVGVRFLSTLQGGGNGGRTSPRHCLFQCFRFVAEIPGAHFDPDLASARQTNDRLSFLLVVDTLDAIPVYGNIR
jgi:hypothetical protein